MSHTKKRRRGKRPSGGRRLERQKKDMYRRIEALFRKHSAALGRETA